MKHIKSIIRFAALLLLMVCAQSVKAQQTYIMVHKVDGTVLRIAVSDVDSVTFTDKAIGTLSYEYVDLGLSVMWATCNIGANTPEGYGSYFAWGETIDKSDYSDYNYKWYGTDGKILKYNLWKAIGNVDMKYGLDADDDAAHVLLGEGWRIPSFNEFRELINNCSMTYTEQNGVAGCLFTSYVNNNSIFMPFSGEFWENNNPEQGSYSIYHSNALYINENNVSSYAWGLYFRRIVPSTRVYADMSTYNRAVGLPIRPVYSTKSSFDNNVLEVGGIYLESRSLTVDVDHSSYLYAYVETNNGVYLQPEFRSDNDSIAIVYGDGTIYGVSEGHCTITVSWGDYSETCDVTVKEYVPEFKMTVDSLTMFRGQRHQMFALLDGGEVYAYDIEWTSSDTSVAVVGPDGTVIAKSLGNSVITALLYNTFSAVCTVSVVEMENEPVDLGLSVKWGKFNLGALSPEEYGSYYAWGETDEKEYYEWDNYKWGTYNYFSKYNLYSDQGQVDMKYRLDIEDDAAHALLGGNWRMPTDEEFEELLYYCNWETTELNGVRVFKVTSQFNGNSIYLPLSGRKYSSYIDGSNYFAYYCSNTLYTSSGLSQSSNALYLYSSKYDDGYNYIDYYLTPFMRREGSAIRPVYTVVSYENVVEVTSLAIMQDTILAEFGQGGFELDYEVQTSGKFKPGPQWSSSNEEVASVNNYGYIRVRGIGECVITASIGDKTASCVVIVGEAVPVMESVDLGLSVNWATCNIGASRPEYSGALFAWGETEPKSYFGRSSYKWWSDSIGKYTKYNDADGKIILDPDDDAASVIWGDDWRMPTYDELVELRDNCRWSWTTQNDKEGYLVTSYLNGNSIFLPIDLDGNIRYWTNTLDYDQGSFENARMLYWSDVVYSDYRYYGLSIRPVRPSENYNKLSLSADTLVMYIGQSRSINAIKSGQDIYDIQWISSDTAVACVDKGLIAAKAVGNCVITAVLDTLTADVYVTVEEREQIDEYVDLGLSVKWATCNLGALYPEEYGDYFAWGDPEPYYSDWGWKEGKESGYDWPSYKWSTYVEFDSTGNYDYYLNKYCFTNGYDGFWDDKSVLDPEDDAAVVILGNQWRTPTEDDYYELMRNCIWEWTESYGVYGYKVTSMVQGYENNYIFIPAAGARSDHGLYDKGSIGYYWVNKIYSEKYDQYGRCLYFDNEYHGLYGEPRIYGVPIRAVRVQGVEDIRSISISRKDLPLVLNSSSELTVVACDAAGNVLELSEGFDVTWISSDDSVAIVENGVITAVGAGACTITAIFGDYSSECIVTVEDPAQVDPEYVDLGLSVNWATFNVGAFRSDMIGDYFAWGEIEPYYEAGYAESTTPVWKNGKEEGYSWASYQWAEASDSLNKTYSMTKYAEDGRKVLDTADDVAAQAWGGDWRMPSKEEFYELAKKCTWEYVIENGIKGYRITSNIEGYTDNSIFIPLSESRMGVELYSWTEGYYWSRNVDSGSSMRANYLYLTETSKGVGGTSRYSGFTVRPVCPSGDWQGITSFELKSEDTVGLGETVYLDYIMMSGDEDYDFISPTGWSSSDETVVRVNENGAVTAVGLGSATITAHYNDMTSECVVTVQKLSDIDPEQAISVYNDMYTQMGAPGSCGYDKPDDYGLIMLAFSTDIEAADLFLPNSDYNWFSTCGELQRQPGYRNTIIRYNSCYNTISAAHRVMNAFDENDDDPSVQAMIGEAYAIRAFAYLNLVPYYQFSYTYSDGIINAPCVPLLTLDTPDPSNNPRATVGEIYDQILSDLNTAIEKLDGWQRSDKSRIDKQVAYGLRARAYLNMGMWQEAAADAERAMAGYEPASMYDVSKPFLYDINESNWIWGYDMTREVASRYTYATSSSWLRSFSGDSYSAAVQVYSMINSDLYDLIPETDVRKGWWVNEDLYSPLLNGLRWGDLEGQKIASGRIDYEKDPFLPYTNVKFGVDTLGNYYNAEDWCWMRAEEMYLILAECYAKMGDTETATDLLTGFVRSYRDPEYQVDGRGLSLEDEIWFQRRVELWGEGFSNNDTRRLNKPLVRFHSYKENNCPEAFRLNMSADNGWWLMRFPSAAINNNPAIEDNTSGYRPTAGDDGGLTDGVTD